MRWRKRLAGAGLVTGLALLSLLSAAHHAGSQGGMVRIIVPYTPGSGPDITARLMAQEIGNQHGPDLVVENRPGAGTVVGTEVVQRAEPDGSMVLLVASSFVINPALKRGNYDAAKDFAPVCYLASTPMVLVVQGSSPYKTLATSSPRRAPSPANSRSPAAARARRSMSPSKFCAAPPISISTTCRSAAPHRRSHTDGRSCRPRSGPIIRPWWRNCRPARCAASSPPRMPASTPLPDVPTFAETGVTKYEADIFYGIVAPAKTPDGTLTATDQDVLRRR